MGVRMPIREGKGPERKIQDDIIKFLKIRGWYVKETHGNMYQSGFPDLFITHLQFGHRWCEIKNPLQFSFTPAQLEEFPKFCRNGSGVWVLVAAIDFEYKKLWRPPNWTDYLILLKRNCR